MLQYVVVAGRRYFMVACLLYLFSRASIVAHSEYDKYISSGITAKGMAE